MTTPDQPTNPDTPTNRERPAGSGQPTNPDNPTAPTVPGVVDVTDDSPWHAAPADPWESEAPIDPWTGTGGVAGVAPGTGHVDTVGLPPAQAGGAAVPGSFGPGQPGAHPPVPGADTRRRKRLLAVGAAAVVLVLAAGAATAVIWWRSRDDAVTFQQLSAPTVIPTGDSDASYAYARTAVSDERGYMAWISGDNVKILGADLGSKAPVAPLTVGPADQVTTLAVLDEGVVLVVDTNSPSARALYVLDPVTLKTRWQRALGADERVATYPSFVILLDPDTDRLRRVDLAGDGKGDKWNKQFQGATFEVEDLAADAGTPAYPDGTPLTATAPGRHLLVVTDGTMQVLDPATGDAKSTVNGIPSASDTLAADGTFYAVKYESSGYQVQAFDLAGKQQPKTVYIAPEKTNLDDLSRCGGGVCVTQTLLGTPGVTVVALPTGDATEPRWTVPVADLDGITALGESTLLVDAGSSQAHTWVVGKDGKVRYDRVARVGARVTSSSLLLWSAVGSSAASVGLEGYTVSDNKAQPLGTADGVRAALCSWTTKVLACPAGDNLAWWTFAE